MSRSKTVAALLLSSGIGVIALVSAPSAAAAPPEEARLAGCEFGTVAGTYDYERFGDHVAKMLDLTTGEFRDEFKKFNPNIKSSAEAAHVRSNADSVDCRLLAGDDNRADIAVDVSRTVTSDETNGMPQTNRMSMTVTLEHVDGRWLAGNVESH